MASNILGLPPLLGMKEEEEQVNLLGLPPLASKREDTQIPKDKVLGVPVLSV